MAVDVSQIKDRELATSLFNFDKTIERKKAKKNWQPPRRQPRNVYNRYGGHSEKQKAAARRLANRIQGERED